MKAYIPALIIPLFLPFLSVFGSQNSLNETEYLSARRNPYLQENPPPDSSDLRYPFTQKNTYPYSNSRAGSPLYLNDPSNVKRAVEYDPVTNTYSFTEKIGNFNARTPRVMSAEDYRNYQFRQSKQDYWRSKSQSDNLSSQSSFIPQISVGGEAFDRVFGSNTINITPSGSAELIFGFNLSKVDNPTLTEKLRKTPSFTFEEKILMNVTGSIGDKMKLDVNYNTEATFDFENKTKLEYAGKEDEIIKKVEAGNVSLPLTGSLITGSQSLFGLKTEMQFGKLTMTTILSQQKGETSVIEVQGGAQVQNFSVTVDDYDANKHFFLSKYFRDTYNQALANLPVINSGVTITRIEVWITNKNSNFDDARNIIAFNDLGEAVPFSSMFTKNPSESGSNPRNEINDLYSQMNAPPFSDARDINKVTSVLSGNPDFTLGRDFEKIENARLLSEREYSLNPQLGYISLNSALNADEILAVAYEYTYNGKTYRVGELSSSAGVSAPNALYLKMLKGTNFTPASPTWPLMMKNVYAIGAYQVNPDNFTLEVLYQDDKTGNAINYLPEGSLNKQILLKLLNLDNLNSQNDPYPDGLFDFIPGVTVNPSNGRIFFPVLEPFGKDLKKIIEDNITDNPQAIVDRYVFQALYDSTKTKAQQMAEKNKFKLTGDYQSSSSSEIMLNAMNVPQGSVKVTAGGRELTENQDFTVDYTLGRVTIMNQGLLESGTPIRISLESNSLFNIQTKTLVGTHLDYKISDNFNIGGTVMNLTERPLTQKVNIGDEPISNTIWGLNGSYRTESQWLTYMVDKLPFIETKEPSSITMVGEFAQLVPGHSRAIQKKGNAYIDDFEGSETSIDLKSFSAWSLASTPAYGKFKTESQLSNDLRYGMNRAHLAWYVIDPLFLRNNSLTPDHIAKNPDLQSSFYVKEVFEEDIFPAKENPNNVPTNISVLNLAFYPRERGPYNYDAVNINSDGTLQNPQDRWGGIMRELQSTDFETSNIQFIEFWLMDPFVEMPDNQGGDLYFNLGNVSEDVLKDSRKSFENGLPSSADVIQVDTTVWGRIPKVQSLVNAFNNEVASREYQDVGLDGLSNENESSFFASFIAAAEGKITDPAARAKLEADPSSDNFHYYRGSDYDSQKLDILSRYKNYNGLEGNSPTSEQSKESYPTSGSTLPNVEDINRDNTLSESESFYSYRVSIRPQDLEVGKNYIIDKVVDDTKFENGTKGVVNWYQFRIPINDFENVVGGIQDFKSIRFIRMFLTNFSDSVIMRFARLDLVRGEWRRYNLQFNEGGEDWTGYEPSDGTFDISAVNIEENGSKQPVNYVLPEGINRVIDPTNPQLRQLNEQSIVLKVNNLEDGDARAAYKNVSLDVRQYKKIEMEAHMEALPDVPLRDYEVTAFIRLGSDYKGNFYEYEVPLKVTPPGKYDNDKDADRLKVWPADNRFDIDLSIFQQAKQARNDAMRLPNSDVSLSTVYTIVDRFGNKVSVSGNPNLSNIRTIMIGVRNPKASNNAGVDDGLPKSAEVWLNELRMTEFNEKGGWAANGRVTTKLADFGTITFAGNTSTPGFGSIDKKVQERDKERVIAYDLSSNFELGKFFPQKSGVSIPMYMGFSEEMINPEYNPVDPDILLQAALDNAKTQAERDSIKNISQDYTRRRSINFTNVRVVKKAGKTHFYDLANWSTSYSYNEIFSRNISTEYYNQRRYRGGLNYTYNARPKNVSPFTKSSALKSPYLKLIRDFNFYYAPSLVSFRTDLNRNYAERKLRNLNNPSLQIDPTYKKDFTWNRYYDLKYDITRSLKFDFGATNIARIDEPEGVMDRNAYDYKMKRDSILQELYSFGRTTSYMHQFNVSYNLPLNKIPILSFMNISTRYNATYGWDTGPILADPSIDLGNTVKNSNSTQLNGQMNMTTLYNKVPYIKALNDKYRKTGANGKANSSARTKEVTFVKENQLFRADYPRSFVHKLKTEDIKVIVTDGDGKDIPVSVEVVSENRIKVTSKEEARRCKVEIIGTRQLGESPVVFIAENTVRVLTGVKNINVTYSINEGSVLPGYKPRTNMLGLENYNGLQAPGWGFISGIQDENFAMNSFERGWLSTDTLINEPYMMNHNDKLNIRATFEPFDGLRVDLTANRNMARNMSEFYVAQSDGTLPSGERGKQVGGNFSMSYLSWGTAFERIYNKDKTFQSDAFNNLKDVYRQEISGRLANDYMQQNPDSVLTPDAMGYYSQFGANSQNVLIPAFLAAYGGKEPSKVGLGTFPSFFEMMPNWRVTFDGLSKLEMVKRYFKSVSFDHAYRSSYNIGNYLLNPQDIRETLDNQGNLIPVYNVTVVSINEQFSPLFGVNMDWNNSLTTKMELKRSRTLALSTSNNQINEVNSKEIVVGAGYRFNQVQIIINQQEFKSDLNVRGDISIRDNRTVIRKLTEDSDQITAGQRIITVKFTMDYVMSDRFNLRFFIDQRVNNPLISLSYPTSNTNVGFSVRFTLSQ
ncbi:MAG: cell surface protein SprA [Bacteroidales bacterium]|nr:cell surface protein SprA [Bacteroidales bacterium]